MLALAMYISFFLCRFHLRLGPNANPISGVIWALEFDSYETLKNDSSIIPRIRSSMRDIAFSYFTKRHRCSIRCESAYNYKVVLLDQLEYLNNRLI